MILINMQIKLKDLKERLDVLFKEEFSISSLCFRHE